MTMAGKQMVYYKRFLNSVCPDYCMFASVNCCLWETGTLAVNRTRMIISHAAIWWGYIAAFWEQSLHQHQHGWSRSWYESSSYVERWRQATVLSFPLAEGAGSRPQRLPLSRPIWRMTCARQYGEAKFPTMVLFMDKACFIWEGFSTAVTAMFGQKQTFMLHLFPATNNSLWLTFQ